MTALLLNKTWIVFLSLLLLPEVSNVMFQRVVSFGVLLARQSEYGKEVGMKLEGMTWLRA